MVEPYILSAIVYACLFALMAIGLTLTYMTTKVPNFAYGSFVTIGIYTSYALFKVNNIIPYYASVAAFLVAGAISTVMYIGVLRPLTRRGSSLVSLMIATFAIDIGFIGIFGIYTDYMAATYHLADTKSFYQLLGDFTLGGAQGIVIVAPLAVAIITMALYLLLTRTKFGVAMRASVENPPLARVLGINVERVYVVSWYLAGGFAGLAGSIYTLWLPGGVNTGSVLIVEIFASSVLGGLSSLFGAILGGLAIGGSEILLGQYLALGFGAVGAGAMAVVLVGVGAYSLKQKNRRRRVLGMTSTVTGLYILLEIAAGFPLDFLAPGLIHGFGPAAIAYQKGIPLLIMVATLLILPKGLVSIEWRRLLSRESR